MQITFSDYAYHEGETRVSKFPQMGMPASKIEGMRARRMTLTGADVTAVYTESELNELNDWFFMKCYKSLFPIDPTVVIACDLPEQLQQWKRVVKE